MGQGVACFSALSHRMQIVTTIAISLTLVVGCSPGVEGGHGAFATMDGTMVFPICGDASGAVVIEGSPDAGRVVRAYRPDGERSWHATLGDDPFAVAVGDCNTQVLSSSAAAWPAPEVADPVAMVYTASSAATAWPGQEPYHKFRVLVASEVGTGVVATGERGHITIRTQVSGEYVDEEAMRSSDVDWSLASHGTVGVAFDYGFAPARLSFFRLSGAQWHLAKRVQLDEPAYAIFVDTEDRYLVRTEGAFVLYEAGESRVVATTNAFSDAHLTSRFMVLLSRRLFDNGTLETAVAVLDDQLSRIHSEEHRSRVMVSSTPDGEAVVLSAPGAATVVTRDGAEVLDVDDSQYVIAGSDGFYVFASESGVRVGRG